MKKFKYFHWDHPMTREGEGKAILYIEAESEEDAKRKLETQLGYKHDPYFIWGEIVEVNEFIQPKPIRVLK